ncbi:MAG: hypothetical protein SWY16_04520 [Cyanobacteriota bacterium]|nr:hypothetical protein [Cyanobacteriota bacterium]
MGGYNDKTAPLHKSPGNPSCDTCVCRAADRVFYRLLKFSSHQTEFIPASIASSFRSMLLAPG